MRLIGELMRGGLDKKLCGKRVASKSTEASRVPRPAVETVDCNHSIRGWKFRLAYYSSFPLLVTASLSRLCVSSGGMPLDFCYR
jgi:hypothetical protein